MEHEGEPLAADETDSHHRLAWATFAVPLDGRAKRGAAGVRGPEGADERR
ncbi:hypothetical protein FHR78_001579 [Frigoribacterium faeni]|nr:hypothetical protein [Frigoribacterium faeni]